MRTVRVREGDMAVVLLFALAVRIAFALLRGSEPLTSDAALYAEIGHNLAAGRGFIRDSLPTAYGNFLYPFLLSILYRLFGPANLPVLIFQALLDTCTCWLVFRLACRASGSRATGLLAAALYAIYPPFVISSAKVLTETVSIFLLVAAVSVLLEGSAWGVKRYLLGGVLLGLLMLIRPAMLLFPPVLALILFWRRRRERSAILPPLALVLASYIVVSPWTIRNALTFHAFVPVSTHGGGVIWAGSVRTDQGTLQSLVNPVYSSAGGDALQPDAQRVTPEEFQRIEALRTRVQGQGETARDAIFRAEAIRNIRKNPAGYLLLMVPKLTRMWFHVWPGRGLRAANVLALATNAILIGLAIFGRKRTRRLGLLNPVTLLIAAYSSAVVAVAVGVVRYSYPVFPFIVVLASGGLVALLRLDAPKTERA